jgi:hypothetical protein
MRNLMEASLRPPRDAGRYPIRLEKYVARKPKGIPSRLPIIRQSALSSGETQ